MKSRDHAIIKIPFYVYKEKGFRLPLQIFKVSLFQLPKYLPERFMQRFKNGGGGGGVVVV